MSWKRSRTVKAAAVLAAGALAVSACSGGDDSGGGGGTAATTFVFGGSADPVSLDGAYVSDGESLRAIRQIFDGLVTTKPGSTEVIPRLATSFEPSADGKQWTFTLRDGVKFSDGTAMDGKAVCFNFDRWYNFKGLQQSPSVSYYWSTVFGGFAKNEDPSLTTSLYVSCEAPDATHAKITLTKASSAFLAGLTLPAFSIASPKALTEYGADQVSGTGDAPQFTGTFDKEHPVGTGPYVLKSWERGNQLVLEANPTFWGEKAKIKTIIIKPIADGPARAQALKAGDVDGYDLVDPSDIPDLKGAGYQLISRPAFNVAYMGFNQKIKPLDNPKIREAIAHAINRDNIVKTNYPSGTVVAKEFMPPELFGYADDVKTYDYNVAEAKKLIAESGVANPTLEFWYPTDVSRPYMPDPAANYQLMKADLEAVGFKVTTKSAPWSPDYLAQIQDGKAAVYLYGWTGDFGDPDNFVGTFFQTAQPQWGFTDPALFTLLDQAEAETDEAKRVSLYQDANRKIMELLPGLPYVHTQPTLAFAPGVKGFIPSPVTNEDFSVVTYTKGS